MWYQLFVDQHPIFELHCRLRVLYEGLCRLEHKDVPKMLGRDLGIWTIWTARPRRRQRVLFDMGSIRFRPRYRTWQCPIRILRSSACMLRKICIDKLTIGVSNDDSKSHGFGMCSSQSYTLSDKHRRPVFNFLRRRFSSLERFIFYHCGWLSFLRQWMRVLEYKLECALCRCFIWSGCLWSRRRRKGELVHV